MATKALPAGRRGERRDERPGSDRGRDERPGTDRAGRRKATSPGRPPEGTLVERARALLRASPGYAVAGFVHLLALLLLSLISVAAAVRDEVALPVEVRIVAQTDISVGPDLLSAARPDVAPPLPEVAEANTQDPFQEAFGQTIGHLATQASAGLGAGGGAGRGGSRDARGGASAGSDAAIRAALDWLARHRTPEGAWGTLARDCGRKGPRVQKADTACTALALLCFLFAGEVEAVDERYPGLVARATDWLVERVDAAGVVGDAVVRADWIPRRGYEGYHQGITALALAEALTRREHPPVRAALRRLVERLEAAQARAGGWRYVVAEEGDTSVTAWTVMALKAAERAGVPVRPATWAAARGFVEAVSRPDGKTEYMLGYDEDDSAKDSPGMHATGLFLRVMFGERPDTARNRAAVDHVLGIMDGDPEEYDAYAVYAGALAMLQVGGEPWRAWNQPVRDGVVARQAQGEGCERGSWDDDRLWMWNDRLLSTVFATLTLETYYRYAPVFGDDGAPTGAVDEGAPTGAGDEGAPLAPRPVELTRGFDLLRAAERQGADVQAARAARGALEEALAGLEREARPGAAVLRAEARAGLVVAAALARDTEQVLARSDEYLRGLAPGAAADPAVVRARRAALLARALDVLGGAQGDPVRAGAELRVLEGGLRRLLDHAPPGGPERAPTEEAVAELERACRRLALAAAPDLFLAQGLAALPPARGPVGDDEALLLDLLLARAEAALTGDGVDAAAVERAEADLARVAARDLPGRPSAPDVRARLLGRLDRARLLRLTALQALGRDRDLLGEVAALRAAPGEDTLRAAAGDAAPRAARGGEASRAAFLDALELGALLRRRGQADASASEAERLLELARAALADPAALAAARPATWLALGALLLEAGDAHPALRCAEQALAASPPPAPDEALDARVLRATARLALGQADRAEADVAAAERGGLRDRVDVRQARAALLRAERRHGDALAIYHAVVRALDGRDPPAAWWTAVEETARAYAEAGDLPAARRVLAELARRDRSFGGDPTRERRLIELMVQLDARR